MLLRKGVKAEADLNLRTEKKRSQGKGTKKEAQRR